MPIRASTAQSDAICTGLQLTNFWQDVALDWTKGRIYVPREDLKRFGVSEAPVCRGSRGCCMDRADALRGRAGAGSPCTSVRL